MVRLLKYRHVAGELMRGILLNEDKSSSFGTQKLSEMAWPAAATARVAGNSALAAAVV